jgi:hypothetical protein
MPVAEKFKALGVGNGFPFCLGKFALNGTDEDDLFWQSEVDTDTFEPLSLEQAMHLFWNLYSISGSASSSYKSTSASVDGTLTVEPEEEPIKRVSSKTGVRFGELGGITDSDSSDLYYSSAILTNYGRGLIGTGIIPLRIYGTDKTDEEDFLGYGFINVAEARATSSSGGANTASARAVIGSFAMRSGVSSNRTFETVNFDGIPLVKSSYKYESDDATASATIGELEFYTYPE